MAEGRPRAIASLAAYITHTHNAWKQERTEVAERTACGFHNPGW